MCSQTSWEYSDVDPEYGALWNAFNKVQGAPTIEALKRYDGFKDVNVLVDVGGYQGATVAAIVAAHPHIRGINFDLPHVIWEAYTRKLGSLPNASFVCLQPQH